MHEDKQERIGMLTKIFPRPLGLDQRLKRLSIIIQYLLFDIYFNQYHDI